MFGALLAALAASSTACTSQVVDAVLGCDDASCAGAPAQRVPLPVHRYSFDATGTDEVRDSIGGRSGVLVGARYGTDADAGSVVFAGEQLGEYVDLPSHMLWGLRDATLESWVKWRGGGRWQRVFDFGEDETGVRGQQGTSPRSYLFLAFKPEPRVAFKKPSSTEEIFADTGVPMVTDVQTHLAVVVDDTNQSLALYVDGRLGAIVDFPDSLSDIYDTSAWLGQSLYRIDAEFGGSMAEFRIYDTALSADQLLDTYLAGPNALAQ